VCMGALILATQWGLLPAISSWPVTIQTLWSSMQPAPAPTNSRRAETGVRVKVASARLEDVPIYLSTIGTVQAYNTASLKTRVDGEITQILFQEGQDVKSGDPLIIIDRRPYEAQLHQQEAMRLKDQAQLDQAVLDLRRYEALVKTKATTQQQLDQQRYLVEQLRAQVESDIAQIDYARAQLDYTTIKAPFSGRIGVRLVDLGNIVYFKDNTTIAVLTQLQPISVIFTLASNLAAQNRLTLGRVRVPVIAYGPDFSTELDRGSIDLLDNQVDQTTGTIKLKASFPNAALRLWPGNFINGRLIVDTRQHGVTIPSAAVRFGPRGNFVWVVRPDRTVELRTVAVVQAFNGRTLVSRGLASGDEVVTEGHFLLENGKAVEIIGREAPASSPQAGPNAATDPG
jgi:multidrug efflux system membrane fusion protein